MRLAFLALASVLAFGCAAKPARVGETPIATAAVIYKFDSLDERPVTSDAFIGKPTVIAFISTGDSIGSQAQANYLVAMAKNDGDRVNYVLIALQDGTTRELVEIYRDSLKITFPVALGDAATTAGGGPFGDVGFVPTVVVIDAEGRLKWKKSGIVKPEEIRAQLVVAPPPK
jgi:hypothetical protein